MKAKELETLEVAELETKCKDLKEELFNLKFQLSLGQLTNTSKVREVKRDIARIKTVINRKAMEK